MRLVQEGAIHLPDHALHLIPWTHKAAACSSRSPAQSVVTMTAAHTSHHKGEQQQRWCALEHVFEHSMAHGRFGNRFLIVKSRL